MKKKRTKKKTQRNTKRMDARKLEAQLQQLKNLVHAKYILGYRGDFKNNIYLLPKKQEIIYPAGNNIVKVSYEKSYQKHQMNIKPGLRQTQKINIITLSANRRFLAYSYIASPPLIYVVDLVNTKKKPKILTTSDVKSNNYIGLIFRQEEENKLKEKPFLLSISGDNQIIMWNWDKQVPKIIAIQSIQNVNKCIYEVFQHPKEDDMYCVIGNDFFQVFKFLKEQQDFFAKNKNPFSKEKENKVRIKHSQNYLSSCLIQDGLLILGTDKGELLVINQNLEYKQKLKNSPKGDISIECIVATKQGFICGGTGGIIYIYTKLEKQKQSSHYVFLQEKTLEYSENPSKITSLAFDEDFVFCGMENSSLIKVPYSLEKHKKLTFDHVVQPFHTQAITGLDICKRKALLATCSLDKSVKIWNYQDGMSLESMKEFDETLHDLSFHPSGYFILLALKTKIQMLNIFEKTLIVFKTIEIPKCTTIDFSPGGQFFSFSEGNEARIFETYSCKYPKQHINRK